MNLGLKQGYKYHVIMRIFIYIIIFSLLILSCKKPYDNPPVQASKSFLVAEHNNK